MSYEIADHAADLRLMLRGASLEELFRSAVEGLFAVLEPFEPVGGEIVERVEGEAPDATLLLVEFLGDVLWIAHVRSFAATGVEFVRLDGERIECLLRGSTAAEFARDVKAVTYHEAEVRCDASGEWSTTIVLDI
jgi:SHS2 domain-containing protein